MLEEPEYFGQQTFIAAMAERFPMLRNDPDIDIGVHIAMGALARLTMDAIRNRNRTLIRQVFEFLDNTLARPSLHPEITNAIAVSFIQRSQLLATEFGTTTWELAPRAVRELIVQGESTDGADA